MTTIQKLWHLLTPAQHRASLVLLGLMLFGMMLETLSVGLVIPALAVMTQPNLAVGYPAIAPWLDALGNPGRERLIIGGMLALVAVYALKALFLAYFSWRQMQFVYDVRANLSQRLFEGYLRQPYTFHLQRNSAQLIRNATSEVTSVVYVLRQSVVSAAEILVLLGISILLLTFEPLGALLVVSVLGLAGWGFNRLTRSRISRWGAAHLHHDGMRIQHLQQGLGGAKDVKLLGRETDFIQRYRLHNDRSARVERLQATLQSLPRLWLELLAVIGLAALVLTMMWQGKPLESLIPTLGLFAAAAFRLLPLVSRLLNVVQSVRFQLPGIDALHEEFRLFVGTPPVQQAETLAFNHSLTLEGVRFQYPSADTQTLHNISLSIPSGSTVGFIGGSGAGKSTLVDILLGLLVPTSGAVKVDGVDIQCNIRGWQDRIGYVPQAIFLTDDTLRRNIAFGISDDQIDETAVWCALRAAQLENFVNTLPQGLDTLVGERGVRLSGGQRQRIGIARALYHDPQVLVLDEASSALDIATEQDVMQAVLSLQGEKTLLIVAHRLSTVRHCERIYRLEQGRIVQEGSPDEVLASMIHDRN
jgi:ABC-type multidrug transport system fused ATPase/permease subunit